jgi:hypothetical protein
MNENFDVAVARPYGDGYLVTMTVRQMDDGIQLVSYPAETLTKAEALESLQIAMDVIDKKC